MKRLWIVALLVLAVAALGCSSDSNNNNNNNNNPDTVTGDEQGEPDETGETDTKPDPDGKVEPDESVEPDSKDDVGDEDLGPDCALICDGKDCGELDGCDCGVCTGNSVCEENMCVCKPNCTDKECGPDGCGNECGTCTEPEICNPGTFLCEEAGDCSLRTYSDKVGKVNYLDVGVSGTEGEALDVDGDPTTCAPAANCSDGYNNQLSGLLGTLSSFVNVPEELNNALVGGDVMLLAELVDPTTDGSEFVMNFYLGKPEKATRAECDWQAATCNYYVAVDSLNPATCEPLIFFNNTKIVDGLLTAGGPDSLFTVSIPIQEGVVLAVTANMAQIVADTTLDPVAMTNGLIGGAIRQDKLEEAINMIPEESLPISKATIINLLNTFLTPDVDTDADEEVDAISLGIKFSAIAGAILGLEPAE